MLSLLTNVRLADVTTLAKSEPDGTRTALHKLLNEQIEALPALSDAIGRRYFNLVEKRAKWVRAARTSRYRAAIAHNVYSQPVPAVPAPRPSDAACTARSACNATVF